MQQDYTATIADNQIIGDASWVLDQTLKKEKSKETYGI